MAGRISGNLSTDARIIIVDETSWEVEATNEFATGSYQLATPDTGKKFIIARASSGEGVAYGNITPEDLPAPTTTTFKTSQDSDDGYNYNDASIWPTDYGITMGYVNFGGFKGSGLYHPYLYFPNITIPKGSIITDAKLKLYSGPNSYGGTGPTVYLEIEDAANTSSITSVSDFNSRNWVSAVAGAQDFASWSGFVTKSTTSFHSTLQSIVNKSGWSSGNGVMLKLRSTTDTASYRAFIGSSSGPYYTDYRPQIEVSYII